MATQYSNKPIVTDGLVYALDFGNQKSYVSGSSSAESLKFGSPSATVVSKGGLPLPPITDGKLMEFVRLASAIGSYVNLNLNANYLKNLLTYRKTYTVFFTGIQKVNTNLLTTGRLPDNQLTFNSQAYNYVEYDGNSIYSLRIDPKRQYENINTVSVVAHRQSSGSFDYYVNGVPQVPTSAGGSSQAGTGPTISGRPGQYDNLWSGSLGAVLIYDRALTDDEIWQNTQVLAPKYGIPVGSSKPYAPLDPHAYLFLSQSGITDPIITSSIDTFVRGLKSASLWDKLFAIYPFVGTGSAGTNLTGSHVWNLKEPAAFTYGLVFNGLWNGSTSGSAASGSNTYISAPNLQPGYTNAFSVPMPINRSNVHMSILSYDTPVSSSYLMGTGMTEDLAISTLAGDYGTPAAAYSVRKVRTAYSGALMDVRRDYDNVTSSIGFISNGDLDTGSLLDWVVPGRNDLPGEYEGLAAAYSLRRVSSSYTGDGIEVRRDWDNESGSFGFDANGDLDTVSLLTFVTGSAGTGSGFVQTWYDQSGNGRHATQTATGSQPLIVSSGSLITENSKPVIQFDLNSFIPTPIDGNTVLPLNAFATVKVDSYGSFGAWYLGFTGTDLGKYELAQSSTGIGTSYTTGLNSPRIGVTYSPANTTSLYLHAGLYDTSSLSTHVNSQVSESSKTIAEGPYYNPQNIAIGSGRAALRGNFKYAELLLYTSSQAANRPLIENNINNYYNIYTGSNQGFVARWYDQSGNNRHATQTATGSQPIIVESGSVILDNNRPSLTFSSSILTATTPNVASPQSIYAVNRLAAAGDSQYRVYFDGGTSVHKRQLGQNSTNSWYWNAGNEIVGSSSNNSQSLWSALFGGAGLYINGILQTATSAGGNNWQNIVIGGRYDQTQQWTGSIQEITVYNTNLSSNREPIEYNINNYYNIYPQTSSFATSSFTIQAGPTSVSASLNNRLTSGISTSGPLGLITVSRTGSNSLTIARNGVTSSFAVPASGALSTGIYLGAINNNGLALGNSPLNISFASVGTGLTGAESTAYFNLVNSLNYRLGRGVNAEYDAVLEYAILQGYTLPSVDQQALQNQLISDLKNAGIWNKLDIFYVFATNGDQNFARLNWKNPLLYTTTNVTSNPIFRTNIGFTGPNRLNTNFPSTSGVNYTLNDASRHAWVYFSYGGNQRIDSAGGSNYNAMENRAGAYTSINNNFNVFSSDLSGAGMLSIHRTSNTSVTTFKGTVGTTHTAASETLSSSPQYIFGGTVDISMYSMGASLVTENNNYIAAFQSYLTAISS